MPELPPFNPSVSVFHLSSKVSNAKIRKYKLATERGMVNASRRRLNAEQDTGKSIAKAKTVRRLKLKVRQPDDVRDAEVADITRPPCVQNNAKRTWHKAFGKGQEPREHIILDGDSSSGLSSVDSNVSSPQLAGTSKRTVPPDRTSSTSNRESYGDLMCYYIEDDDADEEEEAKHSTFSKEHNVQRVAAAARQTATAPRIRRLSIPNQSSVAGEPDLPNDDHIMSHDNPIQPVGSTHSLDIAQFLTVEQFNLGPPDPVPLMIEKLEALSQALTDFGGTPPRPPSPEFAAERDTIYEHSRHGIRDRSSTTPQQFSLIGHHDTALTYGIQFIINALKSWAQQRLSQLHMQALAQNAIPDIKQPMAMTLSGTPEGRAIAAFRAVVESGCLRITAVMPLELSRALRRLYLQIDHLINQGTKKDQPWRCLSYHAQIEANKIRVSQWKEEQWKAEQEMVRQHQQSHQQAMRQMGLPAHFTSTMFYKQPQDPSARAASSRRQGHHLIRLPVQAMERSVAGLQARPGGHGNYHGLPSSGDPAASAPSDRHRLMAKQAANGITTLLPRSGQSMQFSFPPSSDATLQEFGAQSLPVHHGPGRDLHGSTRLAANIVAAVNARVARDEKLSTGFNAVNAQHV